jgi:hypothetical protein
MLQFKGCGIAEDQKLNDRRANEHGAAGRITQQRQHLFDGKRKNALEDQPHQSSLL